MNVDRRRGPDCDQAKMAGDSRSARCAARALAGCRFTQGEAVHLQTPFMIGSSSKSITTLTFMQLVEAGKIDLDAPVQCYLPW